MYRSVTVSALSDRSRPRTFLVGLFDDDQAVSGDHQGLDHRLGGALAEAIKRPELRRKLGQIHMLYPSGSVDRIIIAGLGERKSANLESLRIAAGQGLRAAHAASCEALAAAFPDIEGKPTLEDRATAIGEGIGMASLDFDEFLGKGRAEPGKSKASATVKVSVDRPMLSGVRRGLTLAASANYARRLAATPPNIASPAFFAAEARKLARKHQFKCSVMDEARLKRLGMGGILGVGKGSRNRPVLICLEYRPAGGRASDPVLLVGKTVTFDTGGYSLKISGAMAGMKYDKCGGMAVLGAMDAIGSLKPKVPVVALLPTVENMIGPDAFRVDDVLTMNNGVTVEVTNTDAEGRLILSDALAYGCRKYKPRAVVDLATLTGGVVVALGDHCAGLFCADDLLRERLVDAAELSGERLWQLPLWPEHRELMKGTHSDLVNSGARRAHPIQGAAFLSFFVGDEAPKRMPELPWAHIDIAGVAALDKARHHLPIGPTGFGVRLLAQLIDNWPSRSGKRSKS
ncbi:MAG: leucyl aminopeptidase [Phycisphaeraceae bacterium]|nr:leucyl aminopeptidase [Phycisphaeraceae bacterium]